MTERKSRFGDRTALPDDPALAVLRLRPRAAVTGAGEPTTYPGRLAAEDQQALVPRLHKAREELEKERADREQERREGMVLLRLDPESIGLSEFANRHELSLLTTDAKLKALKASILANGQDTPVRVRPAAPGAAHPYELVEGHRRHAVIRELNREAEGGFQILARLDAKASEAKDLVLKMYRENEEREALSPFETGRMFSQWLSTGLFESQVQIAEATGKHKTTIGQYVGLAELPIEVLAAFRDPRTIAMRWNKDLTRACEERRTQTFQRAAKLAKQEPQPDAETVFRSLTAGSSPKGSKSRSSKLQDSVRVDDKVLFKIAMKGNRWTIDSTQVRPEKRADYYEGLKAYSHKFIEAQREPKK